ncbi:hypothetical protein [Mycobacterium sp. ITM-2016-00318]|nr:hypothetical protein [Mycobacterium sp. ITM-2016-00318]WNG92212.1 hypothetical protein C6A82_022800 [Mycobacterium sp. ITM-2016-00318]
MTTQEVGVSYCTEGRMQLVQDRKRLAGVKARLERERAVRDDLFGDR